MENGKRLRTKTGRAALVVAGSLCVVLAVVGMFLPVLPTTPFLLLAATCYAHSSERFHQRLLHNRWLGEYIRAYREGRGMALRQKVLTLLLLWTSIGLSIGLALSHWGLRLLLLGVALGVSFHLLGLKTYVPPEPSTEGAEDPGAGTPRGGIPQDERLE